MRGRRRFSAHRLRAFVLCPVVLACLLPARTVAAFVCGNGILEGGEYCDDGAANGSDGCCTAACELVDADSDGVCDALDPCTNIVPVRMQTPRLVLTRESILSAGVRFSVRGTVVVPLEPPIDPGSKGIRLVMSRRFDGVALDANAPGGLGWSTTPGREWVYRASAGVNDGITRAIVRQLGETPGALSFAIEGMQASYPELEDVLLMKVSVVIDAPTALSGQCGEAHLRPSLCRLDRSVTMLRCAPPRPPVPCRSPRPDALARCDVSNVAAAQEAYWEGHRAYYSGLCSGLLPSVSPDLSCVTTGGFATFLVIGVHPSGKNVCGWNSCLAPGRPHLMCQRSMLMESCGG